MYSPLKWDFSLEIDIQSWKYRETESKDGRYDLLGSDVFHGRTFFILTIDRWKSVNGNQIFCTPPILGWVFLLVMYCKCWKCLLICEWEGKKKKRKKEKKMMHGFHFIPSGFSPEAEARKEADKIGIWGIRSGRSVSFSATYVQWECEREEASAKVNGKEVLKFDTHLVSEPRTNS